MLLASYLHYRVALQKKGQFGYYKQSTDPVHSHFVNFDVNVDKAQLNVLGLTCVTVLFEYLDLHTKN